MINAKGTTTQPRRRDLAAPASDPRVPQAAPGADKCHSHPPASVSNIPALPVAKHGLPPVDWWIFIETLQQISDWQSRPQRFTEQVPGA